MAKFSFVFIAMMASLALALGFYQRQTRQVGNCGQSPKMKADRRNDPEGQRIVGGVEARPHSHPWIVSFAKEGYHFCGGTLIRVGNSEQTSTDIVITAAHCVAEAGGWDGVTATAGAHDLSKPAANNQQKVVCAKAVSHPKYNAETTLNDIAIIKLATPIKFGDGVHPACLPPVGHKVADGIYGTVAGWGLTKDGGTLYDTSKILMQVGVPIIPLNTCNKYYKVEDIVIDGEAMMCAGYSKGAKDACQGDSGGPLVFKGDQGYVLQGVVSFGIGCARPNLPGVYARVSNFIPWLESEIKKLTSLAG